MATEEERALAYRESLRKRRAAELSRARALRGSSSARAALMTKWEPLLKALAENRDRTQTGQTGS